MSGGANAWAGRDRRCQDSAMVFAATGSASFDFYGVTRHGDNLFADCVLALDARTGKRVWHFQGIKHDVWDYDFPAVAEPGDGDAQRPQGRRGRADHEVPATSTCSTARPASRCFRSSTRKVPPSAIDGERLSRTAALSGEAAAVHAPGSHRGHADDADAGGARRRCSSASGSTRAGLFAPPSFEGTIIFPGVDGGARMGRRGVRSGHRRCSTSTRTRCRGSSS